MTRLPGSPSAEDQAVAAGSIPAWRRAGHRYFKYSAFLRERFGCKVYRVSVDGGFTCPNVDGTVTVGGCNFCDNRSFSPNRRQARISVLHQIERGIGRLDERYHPEGYLAYFQAGTNTHGRLDKLKQLYAEATENPRILGLIIATRPDCLGEEVLDLLTDYARRMYVGLEIGVQTIHDRSLVWMNRGHDAACFFDAIERCQGRSLDLSTHLILGIPGESHADMLETVDRVAALPIQGIKIHNLHVVRGTPLEAEFENGLVPMFEKEAYRDFLIEVLTRIPESMVIHRLTGEAPPQLLVAPLWNLDKAVFLQDLEAEMVRRDVWQGCRFPV